MPEIWDVYDINGKKLNKTVVRGQDWLGADEYHMGSAVFIKDNDDFLIQQRSFKKDIFPGKWSITGGSAVSGENAKQCAVREVREELGIYLKPQDLKKIKAMIDNNSDIIVDHWMRYFYKKNDEDKETMVQR